MVKCVVEYAMSGNTCLRILIGVWGYPYTGGLWNVCTALRRHLHGA